MMTSVKRGPKTLWDWEFTGVAVLGELLFANSRVIASHARSTLEIRVAAKSQRFFLDIYKRGFTIWAELIGIRSVINAKC
jgi:hypothetical protein